MVLLSTELQTFILFSPLKKKKQTKKSLPSFVFVCSSILSHIQIYVTTTIKIQTCPHSSNPFLSLLRLFSCSVVSNSLRPHGLQHAKLPCPSLSPGVCSNSCPLSLWCHPTISSPSSSCPQFLSASGSLPMSWLFVSGGQSVGASASASVLPMNIQD